MPMLLARLTLVWALFPLVFTLRWFATAGIAGYRTVGGSAGRAEPLGLQRRIIMVCYPFEPAPPQSLYLSSYLYQRDDEVRLLGFTRYTKSTA